MPQFPYSPSPRQDKPSSTAGRPGAIDRIEAGNVDKNRPTQSKSKSKRDEPLKFKSIASVKAPVPAAGEQPGPGVERDHSLVRRRRRFSVRTISRTFQRNRKAVAAIVATGVVIAAIYFVPSLRSSGTDAPPTASPSLQALRDEAEALAASKPATEAERTNRFNQEMDLADRMLAVVDNPDITADGAILKLRALSGRLTKNVQLGRVEPDVRNTLERLTRKHINHPDKAVANQAKIGLTMIRLGDYMNQPSEALLSEILPQFASACAIASQDPQIARSLATWAVAFESSQLKAESTELFGLLKQAFSGNSLLAIAEIGAEAQQRLATKSQLLTDLQTLVSPGKPVPRTKIIEKIDSQPATAQRMDLVLDFADWLLLQNESEDAQAVLDHIQHKIYALESGIDRAAVRDRYDESEKRMRQVGQVFLLSGLYSSDGLPLSPTSLPPSAKMFIFWSPENPQSLDIIKKASLYRRGLRAEGVQTFAICDLEELGDDIDDVSALEKDHPGVEFLTLKPGDNASDEFRARFPLSTLPYLIVLDKDNRLRRINLAPSMIETVSR